MSAVMLGLILAAGSATGPATPNVIEQFRRIATAHQDLRRYSLQVRVRYQGAAAIPLNAEVRCLSAGRCIRTIGMVSVIETPRWNIALDQQHRRMTVTRHEPEDPGNLQSPDKLVEPWLKPGVRAAGGELTAEGRHWVLSADRASRATAELYVDPHSYLIHRLDYEMPDATGAMGRVVVTYSWEDASRLDPAEFDESHYLSEHGDHLEPAAAYARFTLTHSERH